MARITIHRPDADGLAHARAKRDRLLSETDWTQAPDNRLTPDERAAWAAVREEWRARVDDIKAGLAPRPWAARPTS